MGRMASRVLTSLALLCATLAWVGWVYLHTIGDPARSENIATAMLADPAANDQIASNFALQIVRASGIDRSNIDLVESAVSAALEDPRVTTDVISAFGAAHANALGVDDQRSTTIDTDAMVTAVRERLAVVSPEIATQLPDGVLPEITLPTYHPPGVGTVRTAAESATSLLAIVAALLLVVAFAFGDRRGVLRRAGIWAVCSGVAWVLVPIAVVAGARAWASDVDAIVEAAMRESVSGVTPVAIGMVLGGIVAIVLSLIPNLWPARSEVDRRGSVVRTAPQVAPGYAARPNPAHHPAAGGVTAGTPTQAARVDTYVRSDHGAGVPAMLGAYPPQSPPPPQAPPQRPAQAVPQPPAPPPQPVPPAEEVDPWSTYFGPNASS